MPYNRVDVAMRELLSAFSCLQAAELTDRLARTAAAVAGTAYAGFVRVDALRQEACPVHVHTPPGDPLRLRQWLVESGVLKELAASCEAVRLPPDVSMGEPGFLATPVPVAARDHTFVWVAGRGFCDGDEHLLGRFATAAGRAMEAASGCEAAVRLLRGVRAFRPVPP
ncbi:hypothetical protein HD597_002435 [Nonomuraea thailandensis]|uniref:GAF domain-containing protein n=1 Tax=Nonomuraea thailandensis TaxID=1188745 RepID=A0A9X2GD32_9ACTN|nr:hypothetical protein [Nonomuraea thailandensis]MCP2355415.1 hypothetical protein [Nonomuraea thailandensis]